MESIAVVANAPTHQPPARSANPFLRVHRDERHTRRPEPSLRPVASIHPQTTGTSTLHTRAGPHGADRDSARKETEAADGWATCLRVMEEYDGKLVRGWKEEMDGLLIFAGLFSAVVTAFTIESYKMLSPDPTTDTLTVLTHISSQLSSLNSSLPAPSPPAPFSPTALSIRLNTLWFTSLTLSLTTALFATLLKQYLRPPALAFLSPTPVRTRVRARQRRRLSLAAWGVPRIVGALPTLLQVSLVLFLAGLLDLLWALCPRAAALPMLLAVGALLLAFGSALLPALVRDAPFESPLAHEVCRLTDGVARCARAAWTRLPTPSSHQAGLPRHAPEKAAVHPADGALALHAPADAALDRAALAWTQRLVPSADLTRALVPCLADVGREGVFLWVAQARGCTVPALLSAVRELAPWVPDAAAGADEGGVRALVNAMKDSGDAQGGYLIDRMDMVGLVLRVLDERTAPLALETVVYALERLWEALEEVDVRAMHALCASRFFLRLAEDPGQVSMLSITDVDRLVVWALRVYRTVRCSTTQRAFELALGAALHALAAHADTAHLRGSVARARVRQLLRAAANFFGVTTLASPGVQWFWLLHSLGEAAGEGEEALVPTDQVREVVEAAVYLYRVRWAEEWAANAHYGLVAHNEAYVTPDVTG